jgi:hypothetical protein
VVQVLLLHLQCVGQQHTAPAWLRRLQGLCKSM